MTDKPGVKKLVQATQQRVPCQLKAVTDLV